MQNTASASSSNVAGPSKTTGNPNNAVKPPVVLPGTGNNIIINPCQRGNPVLECIKNVGKEFGDIVADYQVGRTTGVLYLSLKYHRLHPEYIHQRIERLQSSYNLRILLLLCDVTEHEDPIRELTKICLINNITIMVAWTLDEAGFYLSTYKQFEHKPPDLIKERVDKDYHSMFRAALTSINKINKTDVEILRTSIGSFADIAKASSEQLLRLPGFGQVKVRRLRDAFDKPFRPKAAPTALSFASQQTIPQKDTSTQASTSKTNDPPVTSSSRAGKARQERELSPVWDIELDLNDDTPPPGQNGEKELTPTPSTQPRKRPVSLVWDIELDLNSDEEIEDDESTSRKRPKHDNMADDDFGSSTLL